VPARQELAILLLGAIPCLAQLQVGAGSSVITPDLDKHGPVYMAGFGHNRRATGVHDDLYTRCMAFRANGEPLVLCGVDSIGLFLDDVEKVRKQVPGRAVIASTHVHQAPDTLGLWGPAAGQSGISEAYNQFVTGRTVEAARQAIKSLRPARVKLAKVHDPELDTFIHDRRPPVRHDSDLVLLWAEDLDGKPIGTLVNWANHPETLGSSNTLITSDYPAYLRTRLEELLGGAAVFINGAVGGMQSPLGAKLPQPENSFQRAGHIGRRVAEIGAKAVKESAAAVIGEILFRESVVQIPVANQNFQLAAKAGLFRGRKQMDANNRMRTLVGYARFSNEDKPVLEIALIPGEMYPELSVGGIERYSGADFPDAPLEPAVKQRMSAPYRMLFGLANDELGYIIPKAEWDQTAPWLQDAGKRWYGEVNSTGPEAAPIINGAFADLVQGVVRIEGARMRGGVLASDHLYTWGDRVRLHEIRSGAVRELGAETGFGPGGCAVDVNGDGRLGLVLHQLPDTMVWLGAPDWRPQVADTDAGFRDCLAVTLFGRRGILVLHRQMQVRFYEARPSGPWPYREIYSIYTPSAQGGFSLTDVDDDGLPDILCGNYWIQSPAKFELPWRLFAINDWWDGPRSAMLRLGPPSAPYVAAQSEEAPARIAWFDRPKDPRHMWTERPIALTPPPRRIEALAVTLAGDLIVGENAGEGSRLVRISANGTETLATSGGFLGVWSMGDSLIALTTDSVRLHQAQRRK
jgi:hypothetical protein